jgi:hypothetical protein
MLSIDTIIDLYSSGNIDYLPSKEELIKTLMELVRTPSKNKKTKKVKDPNAPKRPTSPYMIWLNTIRGDIKSTYFDDYDSIGEWDLESKTDYYISKGLNKPIVEGKPKIVALITSKAGLMWKSMTSEDKEEYYLQFKKAKEEYELAKESYNPELSMLEVMRKEEIQIKIPEDWEGPHINMCIDKTIKGAEGGTIKIFKSFDEAVKKAIELDLECYGITQTKRGFSVRFGTLTESENAIASWTKKDFVNPIKSKSKSKSKKTTEITGTTESLESSGVNVEDSDSEEEDDMEVEEVEIEGTTYYLNEATGDLYDPESSECVGKYVDGKISK